MKLGDISLVFPLKFRIIFFCYHIQNHFAEKAIIYGFMFVMTQAISTAI